MALTQPFLIFPDSGVRTGMPSDGANFIHNFLSTVEPKSLR